MNRPLTIGVIGTGAGVTQALGARGPAAISDPLALPATIEGPHGRAWLADQAAQRATLDCPAEKDGTVAHFVIEAPWAHPLWHSYSLILLHLRPMPGVAAPEIYLAGATHELVLYALNPDAPRAPLVAGTARGFPWLEPTNFAAQIIEPTDAAALARIEQTIRLICAGDLSPDTDFRAAWAELFGGNMLRA